MTVGERITHIAHWALTTGHVITDMAYGVVGTGARTGIRASLIDAGQTGQAL